jgi:uncharacterized protein with von Willebrand factor type A (vWA) domain
MLRSAPPPSTGAGQLAVNIAHFARVLRAAGIPLGPGKVLAALDAATLVGIERREDFRAGLAALLLDRREQREVFDQAFDLFWRDPRLTEKMLHSLLPQVSGRMRRESPAADVSRRVAEALLAHCAPEPVPESEDVPVELDAALSVSAREVLQKKDFEAMSTAELAAAKKMIAWLRLPLPQIRTRRHASATSGPVLDMRSTLRRSLRTGGEMIVAARARPRSRPPTLVALCDVSGSMARYSRMLLHLLHALTNDRDRVHTFTFGTRLTNITRQLRHRDVDRALADVARAVPDWSGGTRIGEALGEFNLRWSRRVLSQGAVVLLISDGLDCGEGSGLEGQMQRLRRSCRRILWLNPLLRFDGFEPRAAGIRAMLPHVDSFLPAHNVASLAELGRALSADGVRRRPVP